MLHSVPLQASCASRRPDVLAGMLSSRKSAEVLSVRFTWRWIRTGNNMYQLNTSKTKTLFPMFKVAKTPL